MPGPDLIAVMASRHGLFTYAEALAAGHTAGEIERARRDRSLVSVRRGVYAFRQAYAALDDRERHHTDVVASLLRLKEPTTVSHESAAVLTGLALLRPDLSVVHVTRPELRASRREAGIHHHPGALPLDHVTATPEARVTTSARTAVDIARHADFARGLAAVDSALRDGSTPAALLAVMEACAAWPGSLAGSRAVVHADGRAANPGESWSRATLITAGLALQYAVVDADGLVGYADFAWPSAGVLGEFDGRLKYVGEGQTGSDASDTVWREKLREDRLRALGWEVVRWTWEDLLHPERLVARIRAAMARAAGRRITGA